jgi:quercetin dioxygenase-like cupin family protein
MKRIILAVVVVVALASTAVILRAQDPVKVDSKHYKVDFENDAVRILRINYGPGEKSVMHFHPESVAIFVTDQKVKFTTPDGKSTEAEAKAGETKHMPAGAHLPENVGSTPMEVILVEFKDKHDKK